jgi:predicted acylesterase/phospholipase RssA
MPSTSLPASHRFGVALGGGTARAFAHVGVLSVLDEAGVRPDVLSGTSFGALIAAHYALYGDAEALRRWTETFPARELWRQGLDFGLHHAALVEGGRVEGWLERTLFHGATFADLRRPLHITCTDVDTGELVVLRHGSLARAVRASCALPAVTRAVEVGGRTLIDGGFASPVPVAPLLREAGFVLGVHTGIAAEKAQLIRLFRRLHASRFGGWWHRRFLRAPGHPYGTLLRGLARAGASYSGDFYEGFYGQSAGMPHEVFFVRVDPPVAWWDLHRAAEAAAAGERAARRALPELAARLKPAEPDSQLHLTFQGAS